MTFSKSVLFVGETVEINGLLPSVSYCMSNDQRQIRIENNQSVAFYQEIKPDLNWKCFGINSEEIQAFTSKLTVKKLHAPIDLGIQ